MEDQLKHMLEHGIKFGYCKMFGDVSGGREKEETDQKILSGSLNKILRQKLRDQQFLRSFKPSQSFHPNGYLSKITHIVVK